MANGVEDLTLALHHRPSASTVIPSPPRCLPPLLQEVLGAAKDWWTLEGSPVLPGADWPLLQWLCVPLWPCP